MGRAERGRDPAARAAGERLARGDDRPARPLRPRHRAGGGDGAVARAKIPLAEFVDLFVRLRHPHHFHPTSWHPALWLVFFAPFPLAVVQFGRAMRAAPTPELSRAGDVFRTLCLVTAVALGGAGLFFVSETLVQFNLYRFSIYLKLLACIGAAGFLTAAGLLERQRWAATLTVVVMMALLVAAGDALRDTAAGDLVLRNLPAVLLALLMTALMLGAVTERPAAGASASAGAGARARWVVAGCAAALTAFAWPRLGLSIDAVRADPPAYVALAEWARANTPTDAVFLVPPEEQSFRLRARRAIVVNYKNVPQLSGELPEWRDRLRAALAQGDLMTLPRSMGPTLRAIGERYASLPPAYLAQTAARYDADYVVTSGPADPPPGSGLSLRHASGRYRLYHRTMSPATRPAAVPTAAEPTTTSTRAGG